MAGISWARLAQALREPGRGLPLMLASVSQAVGADEAIILRTSGQRVVGDYVLAPAGEPGTVTVANLHADELSSTDPFELVLRALRDLGVADDCGWVAGRAETGALVLGLAAEIRKETVARLATCLEVIVARENAHTVAQLNSLLDERARIASAIHESVAQDLSAVSVQLEVLEEFLANDPQRANELLAQIRATARGAASNLRGTIAAFIPSTPDPSRLTASLGQLVDELAKRWDLRLSLDIEGQPRDVDPEALSLVFAFTREALTNVWKHASETVGSVSILFGEHSLRVRVASASGSSRARGGLGSVPGGQGLSLMRGRARMLGGDCLMRDVDGRTEVSLELPI